MIVQHVKSDLERSHRRKNLSLEGTSRWDNPRQGSQVSPPLQSIWDLKNLKEDSRSLAMGSMMVLSTCSSSPSGSFSALVVGEATKQAAPRKVSGQQLAVARNGRKKVRNWQIVYWAPLWFLLEPCLIFGSAKKKDIPRNSRWIIVAEALSSNWLVIGFWLFYSRSSRREEARCWSERLLLCLAWVTTTHQADRENGCKGMFNIIFQYSWAWYKLKIRLIPGWLQNPNNNNKPFTLHE